MQFNDYIVITWAIRGTPREKISQKFFPPLNPLNFDGDTEYCDSYPFQDLKNVHTFYLSKVLWTKTSAYRTCSENQNPLSHTQHDFFENYIYIYLHLSNWASLTHISDRSQNNGWLLVMTKQILGMTRQTILLFIFFVRWIIFLTFIILYYITLSCLS